MAGAIMLDKGKILVVDDEIAIRNLLHDFFTEAGDEVLPAEGAKEALALLQIHNADIIFLDLKLFGMNGIELCRQIRKTNPVYK